MKITGMMGIPEFNKGNISMRQFTKYPSNYVKATTEIEQSVVEVMYSIEGKDLWVNCHFIWVKVLKISKNGKRITYLWVDNPLHYGIIHQLSITEFHKAEKQLSESAFRLEYPLDFMTTDELSQWYSKTVSDALDSRDT